MPAPLEAFPLITPERHLFHELARTFTGLACLAQTLASDCQPSGHEMMADPARIELRLWRGFQQMREPGDALPVLRGRVRPVVATFTLGADSDPTAGRS